jgi:hypothetical protein
MKCEHMTDMISGMLAGTLSPSQLSACGHHLANCNACHDALRGAGALTLLKARLWARDTGEAPPGLFDRILDDLDEAPESRGSGHRFWLGSVFGGVLAASLFAAAFALGWVATPSTYAPAVPEFQVTLGQPSSMNLAIETDRPLQGANISILLAGGVELDGYGSRRELNWTADLKAGVNRLSLPVIALSQDGGQVVVRLSHPHSEQVYVVRLKTKA